MRIAGSRVTGAGHGLGFAIASAFARGGARVVVTDRGAARVTSAVAKLGGSACGYPLDVTAPEQIADVRARLTAEHGAIDVLVNNADTSRAAVTGCIRAGYVWKPWTCARAGSSVAGGTARARASRPASA